MLAAAFFIVVVLVRTVQPLLDGDVWWHLRAGETVLRDSAVPTVDSWTIVGGGMPWISQDWLSNVGMAALYSVDGHGTLLSLAFGAIVVVAFLVLWSAARRRYPSSSTVGRVMCLGAGLVVAAPVVGVRVQTVDLALAAVTVWVLWSYLVDRRTRWLVSLPLIALAWANLHAGWPLLFALAGAVVVGEALDRALGRRVGSVPLRPRELLALTAALVLCVPALLLNPNGALLLGYPFATAGIQAHRDFLFEWSPADISTFPGQVLAAFIVLFVLPALVFAHGRLRAVDMLWLCGLSVMSLSAIRFVIAIGPIGGAIAAIALAPTIASAKPIRAISRWPALLDRAPPSSPAGVLNAGLALAMTAMGVAIAVFNVLPKQQEAAIATAMPVQATEWLSRERPSARIFNVYAWGGYIGRELPNALVYIDGRSDIYGDGPIRKYAEAIALERDPFEILDESRIDAVVFWPGTDLAEALDSHGAWRRAYEDGQAAVWLRSEPG